VIGTDFYSSNLQWVTKTGSFGSFTIESKLSLLDHERKVVGDYIIGSSVLAGNMYEEGELLKKPPYHFQLIYTNGFNRILRSPITSPSTHRGVKTISDTLHENSYFDSIRPNIIYRDFKGINDDKEFFSYLKMGFKPINIRIHLTTYSDLKIMIEAPIKHYNFMDRIKKWQIETGPILFLRKNCKNYLDQSEVIELLEPTFVHVNSYNEAQFTFDYPFFGKISSDSMKAITSRNDECEIEILVSK